jgi:hypothetical protein
MHLVYQHVREIRQHTVNIRSAYASIRRHTSAYVIHLVHQHVRVVAQFRVLLQHPQQHSCIRQHTSADESAYVSVVQFCVLLQHPQQHSCGTKEQGHFSARQHTSAYVSIRQHTSAYVSIRQRTSANIRSSTPVVQKSSVSGLKRLVYQALRY